MNRLVLSSLASLVLCACSPPQTDSNGGSEAAPVLPEYVMHDAETHLQASSPNQFMAVTVDRNGLHVAPTLFTEDWSLRLSTVAVGRPDAKAAFAPVRTTASDARAVVEGTSVDEYFDNRPDGIEHGWTLSEKPIGDGALEIDVRFDGLLVFASSRDATSVDVGTPHRRFLRYHSLRAWDADGRALAASMTTTAPNVVRLTVDDEGARYPITVDPTLSRLTQQAGSDSAASDEFGASVTVDGTTAAVGAPGHAGGVGAVYLFEQVGGSWNEIAKISAPGGSADDRFGAAVALNGSTLLVGAPGADDAGVDRGAGHVFANAGGVFNFVTTLEPTDVPDGAAAGTAVFLANDAITDPQQERLLAFLGAPTAGPGAVVPFAQSLNGNWLDQGVIDAPTVASASFGAALAFDEAELELFVGDPGYDGATTDTGGVHRYGIGTDALDPDFVTFTPAPTISTTVGATGDSFGASLSYASGVLAVGAPAHGSSGAVFRHGRNSGGPDQFGLFNRIVDGGLAAAARFGASVHNAGQFMVVGAPDDGGGTAVFLGKDEGGANNWGVISRLASPNGGASDRFGSSVSMNAALLVGAPSEASTGQVHFYNLAGEIVAADDVYSVEQGSILSVAGPGVLSNDIDPEGDPLTANLVANVTDGSLNLASNGGFSFDPGAVGDVTFTYTATDSNTTSSPATVTITVTPPNQPPNANDDFATTDRDTLVTVPVLANDSDPEGDDLTIDSVGSALNGTVAISGATIEYTPDAGFSGTDMFTYTVGATGGFDSATVTVSVTAANQPPVANQDTVSTIENAPVAITPLANDSDPENDTLTLDSVDDPDNGSITIAGSTVNYTPDPGFAGFDIFAYRVADSAGNLAQGTIRVAVSSIPDEPTANDDTASTDENAPVLIDVLANDTDPDSTLSVAQVSQPMNGTTRIVGGLVEYTPDNNFVGTDTFTYSATDGGQFDQATVTVTVVDVNLAPVFEAPTPLSTIQDTAGNTITFRVYASDGDGDTVTYNLQNPPSGTMLDGATGNFTWVTSGANQGLNQLFFEATDGTATSTATVRVELAFTDDDGDGVSDDWELLNGLDTTTIDTDGDTISDGEEVGPDLDNPYDSDGDGEFDALELDSDDDGYPDEDEAGDSDVDTAPRDTDGDEIPDFRDLDSDDDGVLDALDNCLLEINDLQENLDGDSRGDVCDVDIDGDGILNTTEPSLGLDEANPDSDFDNIADAEEVDSVGDPLDTDGDDTIDALDTDSDDDGVDDIDEAGDEDLSTRAVDTDGDDLPDYRDPDSDNDGVDDGADNCRVVPNASQADMDENGIGDLCDAPPETDNDGDGVDNDVDNCPETENATQTDSDGDGQGDACDEDDDDDMVADADDNCPNDPNEDQADVDEDGDGDACDPDSDNDGINDDVDNCPNDANPDQADEDDDGDGDACDAPVDIPPMEEPPDEGCCRVVKNRPTSSGWGVLLLVGLMLGWRRRGA